MAHEHPAGEPGPLAERLRARGLRLTSQRRQVLEAVAALDHATPEAIGVRLREQAGPAASAPDLSTVYRTLELLEELGLVVHTHLGHGAPTYHAADDADHLHLVCRECGGINEVAPEVLDSAAQQIAAKHGFAVDASHFAIFGTCTVCTG